MNSRFAYIALAAFVLGLSTIIGGTFGSRLYQHGTGSRLQSGSPSVSDGSGANRIFMLGRTNDAAEEIERDYHSAIAIVSSNYASDIDYEKINQSAIQGMLSSLDPHSNFFTRAEFTKLQQDQEARFYGIGVTILRHRDGVYVQSAVEGTPAARAGLRYGDRILEVDGKDAREWTPDQVSKSVRGERGESVTLKVERAGKAPTPLYFTIVRDAVPLPSLRNAFMLRPATGYVEMRNGFSQATSEELRSAIQDLKAQGMRQLILDLRGNPGGLLDQAISVASQFLPRGHTIVSVRGREHSQPRVYQNTEADPEDFPLVVLINRGSASASEIVAGAMQDHGRGLVIGETSFGKGLVQRVFRMPFGTGLTLTTAKYYTPYGRLIQRDYSSGSLYDYVAARYQAEDELIEPAADETPSPVQEGVAASEPTPTPRPAGPAVKTAGGRIFYGGGGITPDIKVRPLAASAPLRAYIFEAAFYFTRELVAGQIPGFESYRVERSQYGRFPRPTDFPVTDRVIDAFREYVRRDAQLLGLTPAQVNGNLDFTKLRIRDEIVTAAYSIEAGGRVLLESDPQVLRAVEALPDAKRLAESVLRTGSLS